MRVLITGGAGFVGRHLIAHLKSDPLCDIWALRRPTGRLPEDPVFVGVHWESGDLLEPESIQALIAEARPDRLFHLAGQSQVSTSWDAPAETVVPNVAAQIHLLEAVRLSGRPCRILVVGSSDEYGWVRPEEIPVTEDQPLRPLSPYAVSKAAQDLMAFQYHQSYGLDIVRTRSFNHTGPGRPEHFAASGLARQIARIEAGFQEPIIHVGNLDAIRDFTDVRDVVRAYWLCLEKAPAGAVFNICSGRPWSIREVLACLLRMAEQPIEVRMDPQRLRPSDIPIMVGDYSRFRRATGWEPRIPFEQTLQDLLAYWRSRIQQDRAAEPPAGIIGSRATPAFERV